MHTRTLIKFWVKNILTKLLLSFSIAGRSHDASYNLFRLGKPASAALKDFVETGRCDGLDHQRGDDEIVFDEFTLPPIASGGGRSEAKFFLDGNHSMVSLATRIVPSPDWFIGLDSFQVYECATANCTIQ